MLLFGLFSYGGQTLCPGVHPFIHPWNWVTVAAGMVLAFFQRLLGNQKYSQATLNIQSISSRFQVLTETNHVASMFLLGYTHYLCGEGAKEAP